jgi:hypothetical protein
MRSVHVRKRFVAGPAALVLALALAASAVAGGGEGPPGPPPVYFYPDDPSLSSVFVDPAGHALLGGRVACTEAGRGTVSINLWEIDADGNYVASGSGQRTAACPAGRSLWVQVHIVPGPGERFVVGGTGGGDIGFEYETVPEPGGTRQHGELFGWFFEMQFLAA